MRNILYGSLLIICGFLIGYMVRAHIVEERYALKEKHTFKQDMRGYN